MKQMTPYPLWCLKWELALWERAVTALLTFGRLALAPGEETARFSRHFEITHLAGERDLQSRPRGWSAYLMTSATHDWTTSEHLS